jgi:hypothetical protein
MKAQDQKSARVVLVAPRGFRWAWRGHAGGARWTRRVRGRLGLPRRLPKFREEVDAVLRRAAAAFIEAGTTEGLDSSCLAGIRRPEFVLRLNSTEVKIEPEVTVAKTDLERLPGSYAAEEMGLSVKVELVEGRLRLTVIEGPPFPPSLLIPTSPTRFRWKGEGMAPGLSVEFQVTGGKATALNVVQPGKPELVMKRSE